MITIDQAKELKYRDILVDSNGRNWRVNGMVKTWKKDSNRIQIPIKHGLYDYGYIDQDNLYFFFLTR